MRRFYAPPELCLAARIELTGSEAHHAARVLRVQPGETVRVLDGAGHVFTCDIETVARDGVSLRIRQKTFCPRLPCQITLLQAIPKGKAMDYIVQKATELGAARIVPILSARTVVALDGRIQAATDKADKLRPIALEAIKQCGSPWLPRIEPVARLEEFLARQETFDLPLVASLAEAHHDLRGQLRSFTAKQQRMPATAGIWIGPEGDFSPEEMTLLQAHGYRPITLGRLILRSDTAAIASLAVLNYELQRGQPPEATGWPSRTGPGGEPA
ncbi:MAG TPA: RsmE family RNA methyltransferase [Verrucomicrobiota bacterium]|nr:RsmE family RNA methyltransferase [Verrucomicrobiota bacterium]HNT13927.1 RsmE family RNA methyltransferase [Verrucomicrobiota bacterium]